MIYQKQRIRKSKDCPTKSESLITKDHEEFFKSKNILYYHTKVKGDLQSHRGKIIMKKNRNCGFFDMVLIIDGRFVGLELKSGLGGYWMPDQIRVHGDVVNAGGLALVSNSVKQTEDFLIQKGLIV